MFGSIARARFVFFFSKFLLVAFGCFVPLQLVGRGSLIVCLCCKFACLFEKCFFLLKVTYEICHCQLYSKCILDTRSFLFALPLHWEQKWRLFGFGEFSSLWKLMSKRVSVGVFEHLQKSWLDCYWRINIAWPIYRSSSTISTRLTTRLGLAGTVPVLRLCPSRLVEISRFFVCLWRSLKNSQKPWVAGVKTFFFWCHLKIHAKTTTVPRVPVLCLRNMVTLISASYRIAKIRHAGSVIIALMPCQV